MKIPCWWFLAVVWTLVAVPCSESQTGRPVHRTFTDSAGRKLEAVFVRVKDGRARVVRVSDGQFFDLEIATLSAEDQEWIARQTTPDAGVAGNAGEQREFGGWSRLIIRMPGGLDAPSTAGTGSKTMLRRMDALHHTAILPHGFWVKLNVLTGEGNLESLVKFGGESAWEVRVEDHVTYVSRDGGPLEAVGVSFPLADPVSWLAQRNPTEFPGPVSVEIRGSDQVECLESLPFAVHAIVCDDVRLEETGLRKIAGTKPLALDLGLDYGDVRILGEFAGMESLVVSLSNIPSRREAGRVVAEAFDFPVMPTLRDLAVRSVAAPPGFPESLVSWAPMIRFFHFSVGGDFPAAFVDWAGIDALAGLEAFHATWGIRIDTRELTRLKKLRSIVLADGALAGSEPGFAELAPEFKLIHLDTGLNSIPRASWEAVVRSGSLDELTRLEISTEIDWAKLSNLESLCLRLPSVGSQDRLTGLGTLPRLRSVDLENLAQADLEALGALPNRERLAVVRLEKGTYQDVTPLRGLSNLTRLVLYDHSGDLGAVNLGIFPNLSTFHGHLLRKLVQIEGAGDHPTLEVFSARTCRELAEINGSGARSRLTALSVMRCGQLSSLDAFQEALDLRQIALEDNPELRSPPSLIELPEIDYLHLRNSGVFPDRRRHEP
jgi:hypothetical protein